MESYWEIGVGLSNDTKISPQPHPHLGGQKHEKLLKFGFFSFQ